MALTVFRSTGQAIVVSSLLAVASSPAWAATPDCETLTAASVANALGVPKAKPNGTQGNHSKLPPDNMDVFGCSFVEVSFDPAAKTLGYQVYTPIAKDLASVFSSLAAPNIPGKPTNFSPGIGAGSTGWYRLSANGETYDGSIVFKGAANIIVLRVSGMPSGDATKSALVKAGNIIAKSL